MWIRCMYRGVVTSEDSSPLTQDLTDRELLQDYLLEKHAWSFRKSMAAVSFGILPEGQALFEHTCTDFN